MFQRRFADMIRSGAKRQTIRPTPRRFMPSAGVQESWRIWQGRPYFSRQEELVIVELVAVRPIKIRQRGAQYFIEVEGRELSHLEAHQLACQDGFESLRDLLAWFLENHGGDFEGILIRAADVPVSRLQAMTILGAA